MSTELVIEKNAMILLVAPPGTGKSTFAKKHFLPSQIVSSDHCRYMLTDDQQCRLPGVTEDAFAVVDMVAELRMKYRRLVVIDATNLTQTHRLERWRMAQARGVPIYCVVLDTTKMRCFSQNAARKIGVVPNEVMETFWQNYVRALKEIQHEPHTGVIYIDPYLKYTFKFV